MKFEKILLSFFGVVIGLVVAGVGFYFYQSTKVIPQKNVKIIKLIPSPTQNPSAIYLALDNPQDETVTNNPTITISGKTVPNGTVVINTATTDQVVPASATGSFSTTATLTNDENRIIVTAIASTGEETQKILTLTYSTEDF